jgi:ATP-dependent Clp protease ATP-binding subunit ClpB
LAERYITDREFPDKAFDIIDEVGARSQVEIKVPEIIDQLKQQAVDIKQQKIEVVKKQNYEEAANLRDKEKKILAKLEDEKKKFEEELSFQKKEITTELVYETVSNMTKIPISKLDSDETKLLTKLEENLSGKVIGQSSAVSKISKSIRRNRLGIKDPNKPIGSFIFLGTTGVGKTELAKALADYLFDDDAMMTRIDMSEYQEKHSVSRLVGAPPGYVGYDEGGQLTEAVRRKPYSVVLLDEIEKAHPDVFNVLLQVLDDGRLTDNKGRVVNFKNTIVIMTSNMGSHIIQENFEKVNDDNKDEVVESTKAEVMVLLRQTIRPEFLNRIDEVIMFQPLMKKEIKGIIDIQLQGLKKLVAQTGIQLQFSEYVLDFLSENGYDPQMGARPLKRLIQKEIINQLSKRILAGDIDKSIPVLVDVFDGNVVFRNEISKERKVEKSVS